MWQERSLQKSTSKHRICINNSNYHISKIFKRQDMYEQKLKGYTKEESNEIKKCPIIFEERVIKS